MYKETNMTEAQALEEIAQHLSSIDGSITFFMGFMLVMVIVVCLALSSIIPRI